MLPSSRASGAPRQWWMPWPKGQLWVVGAGDVQHVGVCGARRVAVGHEQTGDDDLAGRDGDLTISTGSAVRRKVRAGLHPGHHHRRPVTELCAAGRWHAEQITVSGSG